MVRLECFIDGKNVDKVMNLLADLIIDPKWLPVRNAVKDKGGNLKSTAAGSTVEAIIAYAREAKLTTISVTQIKQALESYGFAPSGYSGTIASAIKAKLLKKGKVRGEYVIVTNKKEG